MITLGNMLLPAIMLFSPYPLLSCPKFFWASYADEFIIYWFHCLLIEPPTLSGLETHAADEHSPLLMENSLLAVKRRVLFCFFFTPLHYLSPLCFYLFNTSFTFYHLFLPLPPKCSEKQAKKLLAWFLKACFALIEQMALKGSLSLICWDLGRGPNPAGFCNSLILRHQVGIGSGQSLLCHATLLLSSLPPCPIGALAKERKPVWVGSSSCGFFFFSPSQVSSYLNELLCLLNLLCLALQAEGFPFFSCHEKTSRGGLGQVYYLFPGTEVGQWSCSGWPERYRIAQPLTTQELALAPLALGCLLTHPVPGNTHRVGWSFIPWRAFFSLNSGEGNPERAEQCSVPSAA